MEDIGPEAVKRQRLDSAGNASVQRMQHQSQNQNQNQNQSQGQNQNHAQNHNSNQQHQLYNSQRTAAPTPQPLQLHNGSFGSAPLGPPSYSQVPPSPYDSRNPADQQQQHPPPSQHQQQHLPPQQQPQQQPHPHQPPQYGQPGSGYSTPIRDTRPPFPETGPPSHLRRESGAMPGPARSPDDVHHSHNLPQHPQVPGPAMRPVNTEFGDSEYAQGYAPNQQGHPGAMGPGDPAAGPYMTADPQQPNGSYHPIPMAQHPPNGPHHPHAITTAPPPTQGQPLAYAQYAAPMDMAPGTPVYGGPYPGGLAGQAAGPKKNARATQACENCRARKAKCDEGKPQCGACRETQTECKYKDIPPAKHERAQREVMEKYESIRAEEQRINQRLDNAEATQARILMLLTQIADSKGVTTPPMRPISSSINAPVANESFPAKRQRTMESFVARGGQRELQASGALTAGEETTQAEGGPVTLTHNTGAHRLLRWSKIKHLLRGIHLDENYVIKLEEGKGVVHYYGKGQGQDRFEGFSTPVPGSPASPASDDIAGSQEIWGTDLGRPYLSEGKFYGGKDDSLGGLTLDGTLNLDGKVMQGLLEKYIDTLHIMHPIINLKHLRAMFERVNRQANPGSATNRQGSPFLKSVMRDTPRAAGSKRKYSAEYPNDPGTPSGTRGGGGRVQEQPLERRISTAIVLLVLALGKIFEHTDPLPGPVQPVQETSLSTHSSRNMPAPSLPIKAESPANADSPMRDAGSSIPSPMSISDRGGAPTSSSTSVTAHSSATPQDGPSQRPVRPGDRNVDVIPGLAYFVRAVEILGPFQGGNEIQHAQAFILAALYCSQNAWVIESWAWLLNACRVARFHVRKDYLDAETRRNPDGANIIRFVFYTALQLEADILAELDLSDSGIAKLHNDRVMNEEEIGLPKGIADDNQQINRHIKSMDATEMFYSYQLSMRTQLNDIQEILYPKGTKPVDMRQQENLEEGIKAWQNSLHEGMTWNDDDEPSGDINEARLRAKYYGARYIIHRPSLYHALHEMTIEDWPIGVWPVHGLDNPDESDGLDDQPPSAVPELSDRQKRILRSCKMCIKSAIHSTCAFDGIIFDHSGRNIKQRLIVTNVFGTAHAQFGNMLVLSAVYDSYMSSLIERPKLLHLLRRTIKFLRSLAPISSTLKQDCLLLEHVYNRFLSEPRNKTTDQYEHSQGRSNSIVGTPTQPQPTPMSNLTGSFNSVA